MLRVRPRYYRWFVDPGVEWTEANTREAYLDWEIPIEQAALVLVDVWNWHYLKDTMERSEEICQKLLKPLVKEARRAGLRVIHAPSSSFAAQFPQWVGHSRSAQPDGKPLREEPLYPRWDGTWPPADFLEDGNGRRKGAYARYSRPEEPRRPELTRDRQEKLAVHPDFLPQDGDVVVANGRELHEYCREKGILFLFYAGFNTNMCIMERDYGVVAMGPRGRGYACVLVRDCTTGMETYRSQERLEQTRAAIDRIEMLFGYTVSSAELMEALASHAAP